MSSIALTGTPSTRCDAVMASAPGRRRRPSAASRPAGQRALRRPRRPPAPLFRLGPVDRVGETRRLHSSKDRSTRHGRDRGQHREAAGALEHGQVEQLTQLMPLGHREPVHDEQECSAGAISQSSCEEPGDLVNGQRRRRTASEQPTVRVRATMPGMRHPSSSHAASTSARSGSGRGAAAAAASRS